MERPQPMEQHPFLYLIPSDGKAKTASESDEMLSKLGLGYVQSRTKNVAQVDGKDYLLVAADFPDGRPADEVHFNTETQVWTDPDETGVRLGVVKDRPPGPMVLRRLDLGGWDMFDPSKREWRIPIARTPVKKKEITLPQDIVFDVKGDPSKVVKNDFLWAWDLGGEIFDYWNNPGGERPGFIEKSALRILGIGYRVGPREVNAFRDLGLGSMFDPTFATMICMVYVDLHTLEWEIEKKSAETTPAEKPADPK